MTIKGFNADYGDYELNVFASAYAGSVHVNVHRDKCAAEPDRAARLDVTPSDARHFATLLIAAANEAEREVRLLRANREATAE